MTDNVSHTMAFTPVTATGSSLAQRLTRVIDELSKRRTAQCLEMLGGLLTGKTTEADLAAMTDLPPAAEYAQLLDLLTELENRLSAADRGEPWSR